MYCNSCGKPNPDDSVYCSSCGAMMSSISEKRPITESDREQKEKMTPEEFKNYFRQAWRAFITKPLTLALLICYSVGTVLWTIAVYDIFSVADSAISILSVLPFLESSTIKDGEILLLFVRLCVIAPWMLSAVGLWLLYADAWKQSDLPMNTTGFEWIRRGYIGTIAVTCCGMLLYLLMYLSVTEKLEGTNSSFVLGMKTSFTSMLLLGIVWTVATVLIYRIFIKLLDMIRFSVEKCEPHDDYVRVAMTIEFVCGGLAFVGMIKNEITVERVVMCAIPFLTGVWLLQYCRFLTAIDEEYVHDDCRWNPKAEATWQTQNVEKTNIPAWKRVEMAKKNTDGWCCMNCGTLNNQDAKCCSQCGGTERQ